MPIHSTEQKTLSVSQLNRRAKQLLETHLPLIWVSGEISNLAKPLSGHWYFSLKDSKTQVRCAMFRNTNQYVRWDVTSGEQVLIRARVTLYEGRGEFQLVVEHMEAAGAGMLQQQYEALKNRLQAEGLFDPAYKKTPPVFPLHIGVITSPTGAAIHDILNVLNRRYPLAPVTILPTSVQGESAPNEIISALYKAEKFKQFDVLIIARGGGSIEDLWAFNNETLARAIRQCSIPIVSAIGHEIDFTITDFVADQRAPTPSASAEIITPDITEWQQKIDTYHQQLVLFGQHKIQQDMQRLHFLAKRLRHPGESIHSQNKELAALKIRLYRIMQVTLDKKNTELDTNTKLLKHSHSSQVIKDRSLTISNLSAKLHKHIQWSLEKKRQTFLSKINVLHAISPLNVLSRGYSITSTKEGNIINTTDHITKGDEISTQLAKGTIISTVKDVSV